MGQEIDCCVKFKGKISRGKALLESNEIVFRGDYRLKIPFPSIIESSAKDGQLRLKTAEGIAVFGLQDRAEKWCDRIRNPKSVIDKLGVKAGDRVRLYGTFDEQFRETLVHRGANIVKDGIVSWIFLKVQDRETLREVKTVVRAFEGAPALWMVYPKAHENITEKEVRHAVLTLGLKDVKVVAFSGTHTALKFVIPRGSR